jgi:hypothetical protein
MPDQQKNENAKVINIDVSMLHLPFPSLQSVYRAILAIWSAYLVKLLSVDRSICF